MTGTLSAGVGSAGGINPELLAERARAGGPRRGHMQDFGMATSLETATAMRANTSTWRALGLVFSAWASSYTRGSLARRSGPRIYRNGRAGKECP
jgi:hypothetical protein